MQKRGGGYHDFSFKIICLTVPKNFVGEHFGVSENFMYRKILCIREERGGGYHVSPSKTFCHTVLKNFVGEHFGVSEKFCYRKFSCIGGGGITVLSKFFVSQDRNEKLCKGTLLFCRKFLRSKEIYG